jgi:hypothetical protein
VPLVTGRAAAQAAWQAAPFLADPTAPPDRGPVPAERVAVDLVTPVLLLAISVGGIALLMTPAASRDFRSSRQSPAGTNGR